MHLGAIEYKSCYSMTYSELFFAALRFCFNMETCQILNVHFMQPFHVILY